MHVGGRVSHAGSCGRNLDGVHGAILLSTARDGQAVAADARSLLLSFGGSSSAEVRVVVGGHVVLDVLKQKQVVVDETGEKGLESKRRRSQRQGGIKWNEIYLITDGEGSLYLFGEANSDRRS